MLDSAAFTKLLHGCYSGGNALQGRTYLHETGHNVKVYCSNRLITRILYKEANAGTSSSFWTRCPGLNSSCNAHDLCVITITGTRGSVMNVGDQIMSSSPHFCAEFRIYRTSSALRMEICSPNRLMGKSKTSFSPPRFTRSSRVQQKPISAYKCSCTYAHRSPHRSSACLLFYASSITPLCITMLSLGGVSVADEIRLLDRTAKDLRSVRSVDVASFTVMIYDILLTIPKERSLIWKAKWSYGKVLFFATRYPPAIEGLFWLIYDMDLNSSISFCKFEQYLGIWGSLIFLIPLQLICILRVSALWLRSRTVIAIMIGTTIATDAVMLATLIRLMHLYHYHSTPLLKPLLGCASGLAASQINAVSIIPAWVAVIVFDTVVFLLTLARAVQSSKRQVSTRSRLFGVLVRDGFVYYTVMLALSLSNLLILVTVPTSSTLATILTPVLRAGFSVIGSRIVLNLRDAHREDHPFPGSGLGSGSGTVFIKLAARAQPQSSSSSVSV